MRCTYCEAVITEYPDNGICPNCGGRLPPRPAGKQCPGCGSFSIGRFCSVCGQNLDGTAHPQAAPLPPQPQVQTVYVPVHSQNTPAHYCPKCGSTQVAQVHRGFSWGIAILGFFLLPGWGLLFGFIGCKKPRLQCRSCKRKWKVN